MPTLADFWRLKQRRQAAPRKGPCVTFYDGPRTAMDREPPDEPSDWEDL